VENATIVIDRLFVRVLADLNTTEADLERFTQELSVIAIAAMLDVTSNIAAGSNGTNDTTALLLDHLLWLLGRVPELYGEHTFLLSDAVTACTAIAAISKHAAIIPAHDLHLILDALHG
jgi:hypothetical protein